MPVSEQTYQQLALEETEERWELHCGRLVRKPEMTWDHGDLMNHLGFLLQSQLDRDQFRVHINSGRARRSADRYYIPDVCVIPVEMARRLFTRPGMLEVYPEPLPLVVEVWSPSTGGYDVTAKLPEYQLRGDLEIWFMHPYERTLTAWRRQADGRYLETVYREGVVQSTALPAVSIDLAILFD